MLSAVFVFHDLIKGSVKNESKKKLTEKKKMTKGKCDTESFVGEYLFDSGL